MAQYVNLIMFDAKGYASCEQHGPMLCVNQEGTLWRCPTCGIGVSFDSRKQIDKWITINRTITLEQLPVPEVFVNG